MIRARRSSVRVYAKPSNELRLLPCAAAAKGGVELDPPSAASAWSFQSRFGDPMGEVSNREAAPSPTMPPVGRYRLISLPQDSNA